MRLPAICREAWRNVLSGTTKAIIFCAVLVVVSGTVLAFELSTILQLKDKVTEFRSSGASILTITMTGRIDGARCESLGTLPGVRAAGAIQLPAQTWVTPAALPGAPMAIGRATPTFPEVLGATTDQGGGLVLADEVLTTLGRGIGDALVTTEHIARIAGSYEYPRDGRRTGYGYLALDTARWSGTFDECWVDAWPLNEDLNALLLLTVQPGSGNADDERPQVAQLNTTHGMVFDANREYNQRPSRFGGMAVAGAGLVIGGIAVRIRRVELAAALHDGVRRFDLWIQLMLESVVWVIPPLVVCIAVAQVLLGTDGETIGLITVARTVLPGSLGALIGVGVGLLRTQERHLFEYAKDR